MTARQAVDRCGACDSEADRRWIILARDDPLTNEIIEEHPHLRCRRRVGPSGVVKFSTRKDAGPNAAMN